MKGPLEGIRAVDWTIWQQGPIATTMLADLGAEVIKIEHREGGDPGRNLIALGGGATTVRDGTNFYFEANNRHKKSVALDLKHAEGRQIVYRLVAKSDVFVQNFRKGVAGRLGLDYRTLTAHNPRLIYANASGYGPQGPDSGQPSFDYLGQARSGIMNAVGGPLNPPMYIFGAIADQMGGIMLAFAVIAALFARERIGLGQEVDVSHLGSMIMLQGLNVSCRAMMGAEMPRSEREQAFNPLWNHYRCKDGKWICLGMLQAQRYWADLCRRLGLEELINDPRFCDLTARGANARELVEIFDRVFATRSRDEWVETLKSGGDFVYAIVNTVSDLPDDPQVAANDYIVEYDHPAFGATRLVGLPIKFGLTPGDARGHAPTLGQHTEEVMTEMLGYTWDDVARLRQLGVI